MSVLSTQRLLLLDTSGPAGVVALAVDGRLVSKRHSSQARDHAAVVNAAIAEVLEEGHLRMADVTGICVMAGPGSYTGLRIGLATAKGLCYTLEVPLYLQNNLEVLAAGARAVASLHDACFVILPARSGEYFLAAYDLAGVASLAPRHAMKAEAIALCARLPARTMICGDSSAAGEVCSTRQFSVFAETGTLDAWISVAVTQVLNGESTPIAEATPFYLKTAFTTTPRVKV